MRCGVSVLNPSGIGLVIISLSFGSAKKTSAISVDNASRKIRMGRRWAKGLFLGCNPCRSSVNVPSKAYKLMAQACFHPSVEGAQHGAKNLVDFLAYAKKSGASGAQPSNYMLQAEKGFKSAKEIKQTFEKAKLK